MKVLSVSTPLRPNAQPLKPSAQPLKPSCCQPWDPANVKDSVSFGKSVTATVDVATTAFNRFSKYWGKVLDGTATCVNDLDAPRMVRNAKANKILANSMETTLTGGLKSKSGYVRSVSKELLEILNN